MLVQLDSFHFMVGLFALASDDITPWLHPHYRDFNATMGYSAHRLRIGTVALAGFPLEALALNTGTYVPAFPIRALCQVHAAFMPDAVQSVNRFPLD